MSTLSGVTTSLERAWAAIRTVYPDVRPAIITVYLHPKGDRRGHYIQNCWTQKATNGHIDEVHISSHILAEGANSVLQTLLHESVHSEATAKGIQETSRQGRYHNRAFAAMAVKKGLEIGTAPGIGVVTLGLTAETEHLFHNILIDIQEALDLYQSLREQDGKAKGKRKNTSIKLVCPACGRIIRLSKSSWDKGAIQCLPCHTLFTVES